MDKESPTAGHSKVPHKRRKNSEESSNKNEVISPLEEEPVEVNGPRVTTDALSNDLVLKNIFGHLNGEDLESCKLVNKRWNYVLGQIYTRFYEVLIKPAHPGCENMIRGQNHVTIQKLYWSSKRSDRKKFSFREAGELLLEESRKARQFAIDLGNEIPTRLVNQAMENFLSKIGRLVGKFTPYVTGEFLDPLCRLAERHLPNLCFLNLSHATIEVFGGQSWEDHNEFVRDNAIRKLRKICFGQSLEHFENTTCFEKVIDSVKVAESFIQMAPNLKEIHEFPVHLVDALISTGKSNLVKSICYPHNNLLGEPNFFADQAAISQKLIDNGSPLEVALRKFGLLEPKLFSFSFSFYNQLIVGICKGDERTYYPNYFYFEYLKPSICRVLQSSHQTLETLTVHPSGAFDFREISPLTSLKKIQFIYNGSCIGCVDFESFTVNINLERVFPNVTAVEIVVNFSDNMEKYASLGLFSPWGSRIKELVLKGDFHLDSDTILPLSKAFPSLKSFKLLGSRRVLPDTLMKIFPLMADLWTELEVITIKMQGQSTDWEACESFSFDSIFTGIPEKSLAQLRTTKGRKKIPKKKIEAFYANSTIRKLSHLKRLELDFQYVGLSADAREKFLDKLYTITSLSKEFGFDFLPPNFKILIREEGPQSILKVPRDLKKIQEDLASVVTLEFGTSKEGPKVFYNVSYD